MEDGLLSEVKGVPSPCSSDKVNSFPGRKDVEEDNALLISPRGPKIPIPDALEESAGPAECAQGCCGCRAPATQGFQLAALAGRPCNAKPHGWCPPIWTHRKGKSHHPPGTS
jgi:hypothetical protein